MEGCRFWRRVNSSSVGSSSSPAARALLTSVVYSYVFVFVSLLLLPQVRSLASETARMTERARQSSSSSSSSSSIPEIDW